MASIGKQGMKHTLRSFLQKKEASDLQHESLIANHPNRSNDALGFGASNM